MLENLHGQAIALRDELKAAASKHWPKLAS